MTCEHSNILPAEVLGLGDRGTQRITRAMACASCGEHWPYKRAEDLPYWLYTRLARKNQLPAEPMTNSEMLNAVARNWRARENRR